MKTQAQMFQNDFIGRNVHSTKLILTNQLVLDAFAAALQHNMVLEHLGDALPSNDYRVTPSVLSLPGWRADVDFFLEANAILRPLLGCYDTRNLQDVDERQTQPQLNHGTQWIRTIFQHRYDLSMIHYLLLHNSSLFELHAKAGGAHTKHSRGGSRCPPKKKRKLHQLQAWWKM